MPRQTPRLCVCVCVCVCRCVVCATAACTAGQGRARAAATTTTHSCRFDRMWFHPSVDSRTDLAAIAPLHPVLLRCSAGTTTPHPRTTP